MVVFCLSLMGTNITQFIQEAHRVLAAEGVLWISEVGMGLPPPSAGSVHSVYPDITFPYVSHPVLFIRVIVVQHIYYMGLCCKLNGFIIHLCI